MPINNFNGNTFVAYMDISGFKELMKQQRAVDAIKYFYSCGYEALFSKI